MVQISEEEAGTMIEHYPDCTVYYKGNTIHRANGPAIIFVNPKIPPQHWLEGVPVTDTDRVKQLNSVVVPFKKD